MGLGAQECMVLILAPNVLPVAEAAFCPGKSLLWNALSQVSVTSILGNTFLLLRPPCLKLTSVELFMCDNDKIRNEEGDT